MGTKPVTREQIVALASEVRTDYANLAESKRRLTAALKEFSDTNHGAASRLAREIDVSYSYFSELKRGTRNLSPAVLEKLWLLE